MHLETDEKKKSQIARCRVSPPELLIASFPATEEGLTLCHVNISQHVPVHVPVQLRTLLSWHSLPTATVTDVLFNTGAGCGLG